MYMYIGGDHVDGQALCSCNFFFLATCIPRGLCSRSCEQDLCYFILFSRHLFHFILFSRHLVSRWRVGGGDVDGQPLSGCDFAHRHVLASGDVVR